MLLYHFYTNEIATEPCLFGSLKLFTLLKDQKKSKLENLVPGKN
jgi:hypothetical protein